MFLYYSLDDQLASYSVSSSCYCSSSVLALPLSTEWHFFRFTGVGCFLEQNSMHCNVYLHVDSKNLIYWEHTELLLLQFWMLSLLKFVSNLKSGFVSRWRMRGGNLWKWERYFESKSFQNTVGLNSTLSIRWGNQLNHKQIIGGLPYERALQCRLGEGGPRSEPGGGL